jgi:hypothetical protein
MIHTINVMGREYRIEYVPATELDGCHGDMDGDRGVIRVDQASSEQREIILHETIHAILSECGLKYILKRKLEEALVRAIESGLIRAGLIRDLAEGHQI